MPSRGELEEAAFRHRGTLLAVPAIILVAAGRPSALSIALGLPLAFAGEFVRTWAVGYSGVTTRGSEVEAPKLVTAGPYAHVRNPLYLANALTAAGFAVAFTGENRLLVRLGLIAGALGGMAAVYSLVIPHEERFLRARFGPAYAAYEREVPRLVPGPKPAASPQGSFDPSVIARAESRTFVTFGAMLAALAWKARNA